MTAPLRARSIPRAASSAALWRGRVSWATTALTVYTFLMFSRLPEFLPFLASVRPVFVIAGVTLALAWMLPRSRMRAFLRAPESRAVLALFLVAIASIPMSVWPGASFGAVFSGFSKTVIFFGLLLYCVRTPREVRLLLWAFIGGAIVLEIGVVFFNAAERAQMSGTYDPNDLAFIMVCSIPIMALLMVAERGRLRYVLLPALVLALLTIILTKSRGGFIALIAVGIIVLAKLPSRLPFLRPGLLLGGILAFALLAPASYWERMATLWGDAPTAEQDAYLAGGLSTARWEIWKTGVQLMLQNPFLGVGAGVFAIAEGMTHEGGKWSAPHNSFTQIGAELGLLGLALFIYLLYRAIRNYRATIRLAKRIPELRYLFWAAHGLEAAMYGYIIGGFALSHGYSASLYFLLAMSVLLRWLAEQAGRQLSAAGSGEEQSARSLPWWKRPR